MMHPWHRTWNVVLAAAGLSALLGCATPVAPVTLAPATVVEAQGIPPQSAFVVIKAQVSQLLPEDTTGLPHQNFIVKLVPGGQSYTVNNDTKYGSKVQGLAVGVAVTIRGVTYNNSGRMGIHWTHHADKPGDAGYIQTATGMYE